MSLRVSVIVCTYNRAQLLDKLLESLVHQEFEGDHEIIVVNNNSIDDTELVTRRWSAQADPKCPIRYVFAATQGLSHARNVGVEAASGDVVAFIDDDAVAEKNWLQHIIDNLADPDIASVGGKVIPSWAEDPPDWLMAQELWPAIGGSRYGEKQRIMTGKMCPLGGNMAIHKRWCQSVGGFDPQFGKVGRNMVSFEEVEFADRLRKRGGRMLYDPEMIIYHHVPGERMTRSYVALRRYWDGRTFSAFERTRAGWIRQWVIGLILVILVIARDLPGLLISSILKDHSRAFIYYCRLRRAKGYTDQMLGSEPKKGATEGAAPQDVTEST
jgi:glycosyltransferase involved in cell wall biosynthesis